MSGQLAPAGASGWKRERQTASKSMREVAALHLALPGCASTCAAVLTAGMASAVCAPVLTSQSTAQHCPGVCCSGAGFQEGLTRLQPYNGACTKQNENDPGKILDTMLLKCRTIMFMLTCQRAWQRLCQAMRPIL